MEVYFSWIQSNLLSVVAVLITLILMYHYLIERDSAIKLSKRYRNSVFEIQSKIFLNASQYLISGNKDLAIKEFLNAVDVNRETLETYFALGGLFRSNGEIEKAISIHRSLIAKENISESVRLRALKELAIDFDKGGFIDKAIETYKDVLKINRDQYEVIHALCRIYEDIEDWDQAYSYRIMLSKVAHENQAETISHILVQKAKVHFKSNDLFRCREDLEDAFRFAPSLSAKMLRLQLAFVQGDMEQVKFQVMELIREHIMYTPFIFESLATGVNSEFKGDYKERLDLLKEYFLNIEDIDLVSSSSVVLSKVRLLKEGERAQEAKEILKEWMVKNPQVSEVMRSEYIKILMELGEDAEAVQAMKTFFNNLNQSVTKHFCSQCGFDSDDIFWRCPQCREWETIQFRWKI